MYNKKDTFFKHEHHSKKRKREERHDGAPSEDESDSDDILQELPLAQRLELKKFDSSAGQKRSKQDLIKQEVKRLKTDKEKVCNVSERTVFNTASDHQPCRLRCQVRYLYLATDR